MAASPSTAALEALLRQARVQQVRAQQQCLLAQAQLTQDRAALMATRASWAREHARWRSPDAAAPGANAAKAEPTTQAPPGPARAVNGSLLALYGRHQQHLHALLAQQSATLARHAAELQTCQYQARLADQTQARLERLLERRTGALRAA